MFFEFLEVPLELSHQPVVLTVLLKELHRITQNLCVLLDFLDQFQHLQLLVAYQVLLVDENTNETLNAPLDRAVEGPLNVSPQLVEVALLVDLVGHILDLLLESFVKTVNSPDSFINCI